MSVKRTYTGGLAHFVALIPRSVE